MANYDDDPFEDPCCYICGSQDGVELTEDPWEVEINDDYTLHYICARCIQNCLEDI